MAIIKAVNSKASIGKAINYITKEEKTEEKLISGKDCNPKTAIDEMKATKEQWKKVEGRQYKHYIQSFNPKDKITPQQAHEIGKKLIENTEKFKGHEVIMATHVDKGHIHNHFIVNSVNFENGKKYHESKKDLQMLKEKNDDLSREYGLTIPTKNKEITSFKQKKYRAIEKGAAGKGKSYLLNTAKEVSSSLKKATDKESFIKDMESKGYKVNWKDTRKHITFTTPEGKKARNSNLEKTFKEHKFSKEGMINEIQRNREQGRAIERAENTPNINWKTIRDNIKSKGDRISKQPSNDVTRRIQQQVRAVKERTDRATGESKPEDRQPETVQRNINPEHREPNKEPKPKIRERSFELDR